ncbi:ABC transporter ATP-binding protein [Inediibacterium massiliense]|uniref:ABC transporter ATP-binding protein n=1 Tax=Inediibacterium massiliense TaxID=1658111 RepID=UPI0006B4DC58|nr:ABC transporter ATP-binding protein [Inediibacterium massiliense]
MGGNYLRLVTFLKQAKKETLCKVFLGLSIIALNFMQAMLLAKGISNVIERCSFMKMITYLMMIVLVIITKCYLIRYQEGYAKKMAAKIKGMIREKLLDKLMVLGPAYQNKKRSGNIQSLITDGVESFETFLVYYIPHGIVVFIAISCAITYMIQLDKIVGVVIIFMGLLSILIPHFLMPAISKIMIEYWKSYAFLNAQYIDSMQGMSTLKAFDASTRIGKQLASDARDFAKESIKNTGMSLADSAIIVFFTMLGTALAVLIGAFHMSNGQLGYNELLIILFLSGECMKPFYELNTYWHGSYLGFSVAEELYQILDEPLKQGDHTKNKVVSSKNLNIKLDGVFFRYNEDSGYVLKDVNMDMQPGSMTAIVGESGSGKSTIVNLLLRFFDTELGEIKLDSIDIEEYDISYLRNQIAAVFQDTYLFYGTVKENLRMANPHATEEEIIDAAKVANAHDFIINLPNAYETVVGERGATLSGGQRQRISIARAILKNAPILILDEATSSVDMKSEKLIQDALEKLMKNKTTIVIAHRLSTIEKADKIYVLKDGKVKGEGTHEELLCNCETYQGLIRAQENIGENI